MGFLGLLGLISETLINATGASNPIDSMNPKKPINSGNYIKRFIFFLIYVNITIKLQNERHIIC